MYTMMTIANTAEWSMSFALHHPAIIALEK